MFSNRRQLRRWAARVLLLWVFGVTAGVANACWTGSLVKFGEQHSLLATADAAQADELPECQLHAGAGAAQDEGTGGPHESGARTICHAYCDMSALSSSPLKSSLDHFHGPALPAPAYASVLPIRGESPVHGPRLRRDGGLAPPITIAFLRLAL